MKGSLAAISVPVMGNRVYEKANFIETIQNKTLSPEWRNRQEGMSYRQLGRTGLMVSELVYGVVMLAYNVINHAFLDRQLTPAERGKGHRLTQISSGITFYLVQACPNQLL